MFTVVICSVHRKKILHETVCSLTAQSVLPTEIIICTPDGDHVSPETLRLRNVTRVGSAVGLATQRNAGIIAANPTSNLVAFFDDDIELHTTYIENMIRFFAEWSDVVLASGLLIEDGARSGELPRSRARTLLESTEPRRPRIASETSSAYGCNMVVRSKVLKHVRFDDNLRLYAWLEDADFSLSCAKYGMVAACSAALAVHLGVRSGRVSGTRFGFSQIVNPYYLCRKHKHISRYRVAVKYWFPSLIANAIGAIRKEPTVDRLGRLKGNMLGMSHVLRGGCDPTLVEDI